MVLLVQRLIGVTQAGLLYNLQPSPKVPQCLSWDVTRRCSQENNLITCCKDSYFKKKMEWVIYFCLLVSKSPVTSLTKIAAKPWGASVASGKARGCSSPCRRLALSHQYWLQVKNAGFFFHVGESSQLEKDLDKPWDCCVPVLAVCHVPQTHPSLPKKIPEPKPSLLPAWVDGNGSRVGGGSGLEALC